MAQYQLNKKFAHLEALYCAQMWLPCSYKGWTEIALYSEIKKDDLKSHPFCFGRMCVYLLSLSNLLY